MPTVRDIFDLWIDNDMTVMAHRTFWAISKGLVTVDSPSTDLDKISYDEKEIEDMVKNNLLNIGRINVFVAHTQTPNLYAFYFAENHLDAHSLHAEKFKEKPLKITLAKDLLHKLFQFVPGTFGILSSVRKDIVEYPSYLGHAYAGDPTLYKI